MLFVFLTSKSLSASCVTSKTHFTLVYIFSHLNTSTSLPSPMPIRLSVLMIVDPPLVSVTSLEIVLSLCLLKSNLLLQGLPPKSCSRLLQMLQSKSSGFHVSSMILISLSRAPLLYCDNIGAIYLSSNPVFHTHIKHIEINFNFVHNKVINKSLQVAFILSKY